MGGSFDLSKISNDVELSDTFQTLLLVVLLAFKLDFSRIYIYFFNDCCKCYIAVATLVPVVSLADIPSELQLEFKSYW